MRFAILKNGLALLLAGLLLFGGTAKEALHAWTGHRDTVHTHRSDGSLAFEAKHHHCYFLSFFLARFTAAAAASFEAGAPQPAYGKHTARPLSLWETRSRCFITGRGPPVLVAFA